MKRIVLKEDDEKTTVYIQRKDHRLLNESEIDDLSDSMQRISNGKPVFWSKIIITVDKPNNDFMNISNYQQENGPYSCKPYVSKKK